MGGFSTALRCLIFIVPLGIFLRAGLCKLNFPILGCDAPPCDGVDCMPTGCTSELRAVCEKVWVGHFNDHLTALGLPAVLKCSAADDYLFLRIIGSFVRSFIFLHYYWYWSF